MLVSVIIPVYNVENYLKKCIESVIFQTYSNWEIILVDDGSTDSSKRICDEYADKDDRIQVIHKKNEGVGISRNAGIDAACGDYIYFLDADDYIEKELLENVVAKLSEGFDMCSFSAIKEKIDGKWLYDIVFTHKDYSLTDNDRYFDFVCGEFINYHIGWEVCFRLFSIKIIRENNIRFESEREVFAEDYLFTFTYMLYCENIAVLSEKYYHYTQREDSLMENSVKKQVDRLQKISTFGKKLKQAVDKSERNVLKEKFEFIYYLIYEWHQREFIYQNGYDSVKEVSCELMMDEFHNMNITKYNEHKDEYINEYGNVAGYTSVIIPVYNIQNYVKKCIESACCQTCQRIEIILVDDGSTDESGKICDEYAKKDNRIKVIHKENGGLSSARNEGLNNAHGQYIYFLDGDDYIEGNLVETAVKAMVDNQAQMCVFKAHKISTNGEEKFGFDFDWGIVDISDEQERYRFLYDEFFIYKIGWEAWNRIYTADIIKKNNLKFVSERQIFAEDLLFCSCYIMHIDRIMCITDVLYNYVDRQQSLMNEKREQIMIVQFNEIAALYFEEVKKSGHMYCVEHFYRLYERIMYWHYGYLFMRIGIKQMRPYLKKIAQTDICKSQTRLLLDNFQESRKLFGREDAVRRKGFYKFILYDRLSEYRLYGLAVKMIAKYRRIRYGLS